MREQLKVVENRDGLCIALEYAVQTLRIYRQCARPKPDGSRHFAHLMPYRPHFVRALIELRRYTRLRP